MKRSIKISRADVCKEAGRQWRNSKRLGLGKSWADCMKRAWAIAKQRQHEIQQFHSIKREVSRDVLNLRTIRPWPVMARNNLFSGNGSFCRF